MFVFSFFFIFFFSFFKSLSFQTNLIYRSCKCLSVCFSQLVALVSSMRICNLLIIHSKLPYLKYRCTLFCVPISHIEKGAWCLVDWAPTFVCFPLQRVLLFMIIGFVCWLLFGVLIVLNFLFFLYSISLLFSLWPIKIFVFQARLANQKALLFPLNSLLLL